LGAMLARSGIEVTLVCRGAHLAAIRSHGLSLSTPKESFSLRLAATDEPRGVHDVVIQAVKLYDLASSTHAMRPMIGPHTMVLPIQNGVTAADEVGEIVGARHVVGGTVFINAHVVSPGVVASKSEMSTMAFGELDGSKSERTQAFLEACRKAGLEARIPESIRA